MSTQGRDPRIERVIVQACRRIHSRSVRARVALELTNHLEEAIAAKKESGLAQEAALSEAIAEFGDLGEVSATLARVHRPIYLSAPFLATAAMCALLITGAYLQTWANAWLRFMDDDLIQSIEKYRGVFLEDEKVLSADPLFGIAGTKSDAGRFLNDRVSWCGDPGICKAPYSSLNRPSRIRISPEAIKQLSGWRESWPQHAADLPDLDTSWMRELSRFDHWDLFVHGPLAEIYRSVPERVTAWAFPIPSFYGLRYVARARLLQGIR
ncbi:MAG: permease prefix domain 1-containing protein, partial [Bdellovibrionota bacterium]